MVYAVRPSRRMLLCRPQESPHTNDVSSRLQDVTRIGRCRPGPARRAGREGALVVAVPTWLSSAASSRALCHLSKTHATNPILHCVGG